MNIGKGHLPNNEVFTIENFVMVNSNDWNSLLEKMNSVSSTITQPFLDLNIDFDSYICIAVFDIKNSTTSIDITNIIEYQDHLEIKVDNLSLGISQDIAHPFHIIKIPTTKKEFEFK